MTTRLAARGPQGWRRLRRASPFAAALLIVGSALVLVAPAAWPLVVLFAVAVAAGMVAERVRGESTRAGHDAQLEARLRDTIAELRRSRARVAGVADAERRRIERDLHDGCQQRLIAMRIKLALAEEIMGGENRPVGELIEEIAADAETALDDLHALVHGIYPALLTDRGLSDAVKSLGRDAPIPTRVLAEGLCRYPPNVEAAVYFSCAEALQNSAKHGGRGASARIVMRHDTDGLAFEVRDDGCGFDPAVGSGSGLASMEDRLGAVGGRLLVLSSPGCGAAVQGWVPEAVLAS